MTKEKTKSKKVLKVILIIAGTLLGLVVLLLAGMRILFSREFEIMNSLKKVSDRYPVYTMEIEGDYYFDEFLARGGASSDEEVSAILTEYISHGFYKVDVKNSGAGCSVLSAGNPSGEHVWGRNFDWGNTPLIILKTKPEEGYASISSCAFSNISGNYEAVPEGMMNEMLAIAALYVPMDGVNEAGLCVADLEVNEGGMIDVATGKKDLTITTAIRLILNRAATVDEALALLEDYDIHASGGISHHLAISDANGRSVVLEFVQGKTVVVETPVVTNFNMANGDTAAGGDWSKERFELLEKAYQEQTGVFTGEEVREMLSKVAKKEDSEWLTQWSLVYDGTEKKVDYYFKADYSDALEVRFE